MEENKTQLSYTDLNGTWVENHLQIGVSNMLTPNLQSDLLSDDHSRNTNLNCHLKPARVTTNFENGYN